MEVTIDVDYNTGEDVITGLLDQKSLKGAVSLLSILLSFL